MIAVVLPFLAADHWLAQAVVSLEAAAGDLPWQLIVVNDGSSDAGSALLGRLTAHWPAGRLLLLNGGGRGVSAARNRAIAAATASPCPLSAARVPDAPTSCSTLASSRACASER